MDEEPRLLERAAKSDAPMGSALIREVHKVGVRPRDVATPRVDGQRATAATTTTSNTAAATTASSSAAPGRRHASRADIRVLAGVAAATTTRRRWDCPTRAHLRKQTAPASADGERGVKAQHCAPFAPKVADVIVIVPGGGVRIEAAVSPAAEAAFFFNETDTPTRVRETRRDLW